jgi:phosphoribosylformylglycinamidine cyclo-ligase
MKYAESGVNIDAAQRALAQAKAAVKSTWDERVRSDLGAFGGLYLPAAGEPLLVASVDGVGTKVKVAAAMNRFDTVGQDLVNHCVNDILVQGAEPLFFLDYYATSQLQEDVLPQVIGGFATACHENGCALLGGETAEMPGVYSPGEFDLVGCIVGRVTEENLIDGSTIQPGDKIWGLPSSGLHTNGYSLARAVLLNKGGFSVADTPPELGQSIGEALLAVHRSYLDDVRKLWRTFGRTAIHGMAHITGGGFFDNIPRVIPAGMCAQLDATAWEVPPLFRMLAELGKVPTDEMYRVFNMGMGMVVFLPAPIDLGEVPDLRASLIGEVGKRDKDAVRITFDSRS